MVLPSKNSDPHSWITCRGFLAFSCSDRSGFEQYWNSSLPSSSSRQRDRLRASNQPGFEHHDALGRHGQESEPQIQRLQLHTVSRTDLGPNVYRSGIHRPLGHSLGSPGIAERDHLRCERSWPARRRQHVAVITLNSSPTVPYKETLGFNINHTFTQSSAIKLSVIVFKVSQLYVWHDSASYSSALVIPVSNIPTVNLIETFNANFTSQSSFSLNWSTPQR